MSVLKLAISTSRDTATLTSVFETVTGFRAIANRIVNFITSTATGTEGAFSSTVPPSIAISIQENQVQASNTIIFSDHATANDTIIINGVTFTCASSPIANQWAPGANATATATNFAAAVNASVTALVSGYVTASPSTGTVTITSAFYGLAGNQCTTAKGVDFGSVITVTGARLISGAEDATAQTLTF